MSKPEMPDQMNEFEDYAYNKVRDGILDVDDKTSADIYALSFYFDNEEDPRRPTLMVGYNTNARWHACTPAPGQQPKWPVASDSDEAKWNYAFWLQEEGQICVIGDTPEDVMVREKWVKSLNLWYTDEEEEEDFDRCLKMGEKILEHFINWCAMVAKRLHDDGVITRKFGHPIPIIVHELEYYDRIAEVTRRANPADLAQEFVQWINEM